MAEEWYVGQGDEVVGPMGVDVLRGMVVSGQLSRDDMLWRDGLPDWIEAGSVAEVFADAVPETAAAAAPRQRDDAVRPHGEVGASRRRSPGPPRASPSPRARPPGRMPPPQPPMKYAEYLPRLAAAILDHLFCLMIQGVLAVPVLLGYFVVAHDTPPEVSARLTMLVVIVIVELGLLVSLAYHVALESSAAQATWGKRLLGIRVADVHGQRIDMPRAAARYVLHLLTACTCGVGLVMPLFTQRRQTLHDLIAGCVALVDAEGQRRCAPEVGRSGSRAT